LSFISFVWVFLRYTLDYNDRS